MPLPYYILSPNLLTRDPTTLTRAITAFEDNAMAPQSSFDVSDWLADLPGLV
jgi:hypothetical protein